jgi:hypothetical protein
LLLGRAADGFGHRLVPNSLRDRLNGYSDKIWQYSHYQHKGYLLTEAVKFLIRTLMEAVVTRLSKEAALRDAPATAGSMQPPLTDIPNPVVTKPTVPVDPKTEPEVIAAATAELAGQAVQLESIGKDADGLLHATFREAPSRDFIPSAFTVVHVRKDPSGPAVLGSTIRRLLELKGEGNHFKDVGFIVTPGTKEIQLEHELKEPDTYQPSRLFVLDKALIGTGSDQTDIRGYGGGLSEPSVINEHNASRSFLPGPMTPGGWRVKVGEFFNPGWRGLIPSWVGVAPKLHCEIKIELRKEPTLAPRPQSSPGEPATNPRFNQAGRFVGDLHVHSEHSTDSHSHRELDSKYAEDRQLDFVTFAEHNTTDGQDRLAELQSQNPNIYFPTALEYTTPLGHAVVIGVKRIIAPWIGERVKPLADFLREIHAEGGVVSLAHMGSALGYTRGARAYGTAPSLGFQMRIDPPTGAEDMIDATEVYNSKRTGFASLYDALNKRIHWKILDMKHHAAVTTGSDDHEGGTTKGLLGSNEGTPAMAVDVPKFDTENVAGAIRDNRTQGLRSGVHDVQVDCTTSVPLTGDTLYAAQADLGITVHGAQGMELRLRTNGGKVAAKTRVTSDSFSFTHTVVAPPEGESWYQWEVLDREQLPIRFVGKVVDWLLGGLVAQGRNIHSALFLRRPQSP